MTIPHKDTSFGASKKSALLNKNKHDTFADDKLKLKDSKAMVKNKILYYEQKQAHMQSFNDGSIRSRITMFNHELERCKKERERKIFDMRKERMKILDVENDETGLISKTSEEKKEELETVEQKQEVGCVKNKILFFNQNVNDSSIKDRSKDETFVRENVSDTITLNINETSKQMVEESRTSSQAKNEKVEKSVYNCFVKRRRTTIRNFQVELENDCKKFKNEENKKDVVVEKEELVVENSRNLDENNIKNNGYEQKHDSEVVLTTIPMKEDIEKSSSDFANSSVPIITKNKEEELDLALEVYYDENYRSNSIIHPYMHEKIKSQASDHRKFIDALLEDYEIKNMVSYDADTVSYILMSEQNKKKLAIFCAKKLYYMEMDSLYKKLRYYIRYVFCISTNKKFYNDVQPTLMFFSLADYIITYLISSNTNVSFNNKNYKNDVVCLITEMLVRNTTFNPGNYTFADNIKALSFYMKRIMRGCFPLIVYKCINKFLKKKGGKKTIKMVSYLFYSMSKWQREVFFYFKDFKRILMVKFWNDKRFKANLTDWLVDMIFVGSNMDKEGIRDDYVELLNAMWEFNLDVVDKKLYNRVINK